MITYNNDKLIISIHATAPEEYRDWLIKAIAATMRWHAHSRDKKNDDNENLSILGELLEELVEVEKQIVE